MSGWSLPLQQESEMQYNPGRKSSKYKKSKNNRDPDVQDGQEQQTLSLGTENTAGGYQGLEGLNKMEGQKEGMVTAQEKERLPGTKEGK